MNQTTRLTLTLTTIALLAGLAIGLGFQKTKPAIEKQRELAVKEAITQVFPKGTDIENIKSDSSEYWIGRVNDSIIGYGFKGLSGFGYSSQISFIAGYTKSGTVLGVTILSQKETPGLGSRVEEVVSKDLFWTSLFKKKKSGQPWFTLQFRGISAKNSIGIKSGVEWHALKNFKKPINTAEEIVAITSATSLEKPSEELSRVSLLKNNSITAITGATITTKAVSEAVQALYLKNVDIIEGVTNAKK